MPYQARAEFTNKFGHLNDVKAGVREALAVGGEVDKEVQKFEYRLLYDSKNADGTPRPQSSPQGAKKPSTITQYEKHGWNTENYLVRTGKSTTLRSRNSRGGLALTIKPDGQKILSYHIPESKSRGKIQWLELNNEINVKIVEIITKHVARRFK